MIKLEQNSPQEHRLAKMAADLLSAMANSRRLQIMRLLLVEEIGVGPLADRLGMTQSAVSQHLSKLRQQDLVTTRRHRQVVYYSSTSDAAAAIFRTLDLIFPEVDS